MAFDTPEPVVVERVKHLLATDPFPEGLAQVDAATDRRSGFLLEQRALGHTCLLIIDESQNLAPEVLEQIRMISNLETETEKLIQIVLMGQPELRDRLDRQHHH